MRKLTAGVDAEGRSCLLSAEEVEPGPVAGMATVAVANLFATAQSLPPAWPPARGASVDVQLAPGMLRWMMVEHRPHEEGEDTGIPGTMHHSDTVDLIYVVEGGADLWLEDGPHPIGPGDCVVEPGVDHAMAPGPNGCRLLVVSVGTPPPS